MIKQGKAYLHKYYHYIELFSLICIDGKFTLFHLTSVEKKITFFSFHKTFDLLTTLQKKGRLTHSSFLSFN